MQRTRDQALILQVDKFGDHDAIVHFFTESHGLNRGVVKAGFSSKRRAALQPATLVDAQWQSRLPEHLSQLSVESSHGYGARVMHDPLRLAAIGSITGLLSVMMAEQDPHPELFQHALAFLKLLAEPQVIPSHSAGEGLGRGAGSDVNAFPHRTPPHPTSPARGEAPAWLADYVRLELELIEQAGFGLDLTCCAATGTRENLMYVSPKSGRAVSREAGAAYHDKLLPLPAFLHAQNESESAPDACAIRDGLKLTGFFIIERMLPALHRKCPPLRAHFTQLVERIAV